MEPPNRHSGNKQSTPLRRSSDWLSDDEAEEFGEEEGSSDFEEPSGMEEPREEYIGVKKSYRAGDSFYSHVFDALLMEQTIGGVVRSGKLGKGLGGKGAGREIKLDKKQREIRKHKQGKPRRPTVDHIMEWLPLDYGLAALLEDEDLSDAEQGELRKFAYSYLPNLQILAKEDNDTRQGQVVTESSLQEAHIRKAKDYIKNEIYPAFTADAEAQKKRNARRKKLKKAADGNDSDM